MSNFSISHSSNLVGLFTNANNYTNGLFVMGSLISFFLVSLLTFGQRSFKRGLVTSLFNSTILTLLFMANGLLTGTAILFTFTGGLVGAIIWLVYDMQN